MYTHVHVYTHTCIHTYMYTHIHVYTRTCIHTYMYTHIHVYTHAQTFSVHLCPDLFCTPVPRPYLYTCVLILSVHLCPGLICKLVPWRILYSSTYPDLFFNTCSLTITSIAQQNMYICKSARYNQRHWSTKEWHI